MADTLNFNTLKKRFLTITLPDENQTTIMVGTPTKALLDELENLEIGGNETALDDLYGLIARLMSRNKGGVKISRELLEGCLDIEDLVEFIKSYKAFLSGIKTLKN